MRHILEGKLIHVFERTQKENGKETQRFGLQILEVPTSGVLSDMAEFESPLLPRGTNPNQFTSRVGDMVSIDMTFWENKRDGGYGFFIKDVRHIKFVEAPKELKKVNS
ncbi:MAG: hypothetical protein AAGJ37_13435 [Pseudomonadota bacterium]